MSQAFTGSNYIQQIVADEINEFARRYRASAEPPVGWRCACASTPT